MCLWAGGKPKIVSKPGVKLGVCRGAVLHNGQTERENERERERELRTLFYKDGDFRLKPILTICPWSYDHTLAR